MSFMVKTQFLCYRLCLYNFSLQRLTEMLNIDYAVQGSRFTVYQRQHPNLKGAIKNLATLISSSKG